MADIIFLAELDTQILQPDELLSLPEYINAMSNSSGGIIMPDGQPDIHVQALMLHQKPALLHGHVWRRIEGQNVRCGKWARAVMARRDPCDDFPAEDTALDTELLEDFLRAVVRNNKNFSPLSRDEFLRRTGIFSGKYLTSAGAFMFGNGLNVQAVLKHGNIFAELQEHNLWGAYTRMLPRIIRALPGKASVEVRNAFVNSLIHADFYISNSIYVYILARPARIVINTPGIISNNVRNHRLYKLFRLAGVSAGTFVAVYDMLNFRTVAAVPLLVNAPLLL